MAWGANIHNMIYKFSSQYMIHDDDTYRTLHVYAKNEDNDLYIYNNQKLRLKYNNLHKIIYCDFIFVDGKEITSSVMVNHFKRHDTLTYAKRTIKEDCIEYVI